MAIFDGLNQIIDSYLGVDETWISGGSQLSYHHKETLLRLCGGRGTDVDCLKLVHSLVDQVNQNWDGARAELKGLAPSQQNWRRRQNPDFDPANPSDEVVLERIITQVTDGNWWNQIPVEQTLLGVSKGKMIDLVHRDGEGAREFELIELKTGAPYTPLSAAGQVLKYGIVYAFYRSRYEEIFSEQPTSELLNATRMTLVVLAPWSFYSQFASCDWLARFEDGLNDALVRFSTTSGIDLPQMGFRLERFPEDFAWSASLAADLQSKKEVLWAVHNRKSVFSS